MKSRYLLAIPILASSANAEVTLDGTLGRGGALPGPDYLIGADLGQQHGGNLFHSFKDFNLNRFESATFSGPNSINNVINRVTGGNPSSIDGLISSTISADMYFLNPNGLMFGPNARLDIQGSFHASTAHYLRLGNGGRFDARNPSESLLTVAPIESFGFLNGPIALISVQGHGEVSQELETGLSVPEGQTLSLIGGKIDIRAGTFFRTVTIDNEGNGSPEITRLPILAAPSGRINLASVASRGEVKLGRDFVDVGSISNLADIHIKENSLLQTSGKGGGSIFIRGGQFEVVNSVIQSDTLGDKEGGVTDIQVNNLAIRASKQLSEISANTKGTGKGGIINIKTDQMVIEGGGILRSVTHGPGRAGKIFIKVVDTLDIIGQNTVSGAPSLISVSTTSSKADAGDAGNIDIKASRISLINGGSIYNLTFGPGNSSSINIFTDTLTISGGFKKPWPRFADFGLKFSPSTISATAQKSSIGHAGNIEVTTHQILLTEGGQITSNTHGKGNAGSIIINATESLIAKGKYVRGERDSYSGVKSGSFDKLPHSGHAGHLSIKAKNISLIEESAISTLALNAKGGTIDIESDKIILQSGGTIRSDTLGSGKGGNLSVTTNNLSILGQDTVGSSATGKPSSISTNTISSKADAGDGGNIKVKARQISLQEGGSIYNKTFGQGNSGSINIFTDKLTISGGFKKPWPNPHDNMELLPSTISAQTIGTGNAGHIEIIARQIVLLDGGQINSNTSHEGKGGSIMLKASDVLIVKGKYIGSRIFKSGIKNRSNYQHHRSGNAGDIILHAGNKLYMEGGAITTATTRADGGNITITASGYLYLVDSNVTTSVGAKKGDGGNITLNPAFIVQDSSRIIARAVGGNGGNIDITTTGIYQFPPKSKSPIDASSKLGVDGEVVVNSPDSDISGKLFILSTKMVNAADQLQKPCNSRIAENLSSFTIIPSEGTPNQPDDLLPSGPILFKLKPAKTTKSSNGKSTTRHLQIAYLRYCKPAPATTKSGAKNSIIPEQLF